MNGNAGGKAALSKNYPADSRLFLGSSISSSDAFEENADPKQTPIAVPIDIQRPICSVYRTNKYSKRGTKNKS